MTSDGKTINDMNADELLNRLAVIGVRGEARELTLAFPHLVVMVGLDKNGRRVGDNCYFNDRMKLIRFGRRYPVFAIAYQGMIMAWREAVES